MVSEALSRHKVAADNADIAITTDAPTGFQVLGDETLLITALSWGAGRVNSRETTTSAREHELQSQP